MKKKISLIIIVIILLTNLISNISYGLTIEEIQKDDTGLGKDPESTLQQLNTGNITITNSEGKSTSIFADLPKSTNSFLGSAIIRFLSILPQLSNNILKGTIESVECKDIAFFTIYDTVMGNYTLFNFDYTNLNTYYISETGEKILAGSEIIDALSLNHYNLSDLVKEKVQKVPLVYKIKIVTSEVYTIMRNLSIAISLFVLLYIGIRMAMSTVSASKAKYKKMLLDWIVSLILVFVMHYIIIILSYISIIALKLINEFASSIGVQNIEIGIMSGLLKDLSGKSGFNLITTLATTLYLAFLQIKFFIMYIKRFCEITILTVISPLVTITYSIDKAGDNKAQAFQAWVKELIIKVSIQIVHAIIYCLFIISAAVIAQKAPLIALFFFSGLSRGEKVFRNLLNVKDDGLEKAKVPIAE